MTTIIFILITLFALLLLKFRIEHVKHEMEAKIDSQKKTIVNILDTDLELAKGYKEIAVLLKEKQEVLEKKVCNLEWHVDNLNALHKVEVCPTSTDKYDPLNPSEIMYKTNGVEKGIYPTCEDNQNISDNKPKTITFAEE